MNNLVSNFSLFPCHDPSSLFHAQASMKFAAIGAGAFFAAFFRKHAKFSDDSFYCISRNTILLIQNSKNVSHNSIMQRCLAG